MKTSFSLSIFFPAYNEEKNIEQSVLAAEHAVKELTDTYEIIIVDDGSKDKTPQIANLLAQQNPHVRVVHHNPNKGYGAAVWSGIQAARYDYVFFTDADLQFDLSEIKNLVAHIPEYDIVLGYRAKRMDPFMRLVNAKGWNILNRIFFGLKVRDIDCAFKLLRRVDVQNLSIQSRGAMMSAELLITLQRAGIVFKEVPVTHLPRTAGVATGAKPAVILRAFKEMFSMYAQEENFVLQMQVIKFALVGVVNTLLDMSVYILLTRNVDSFATHLFLAKTISFLLGTVSSFALNRRWTFNQKSAVERREVFRFYTVALLSVMINVSSLYVFVQLFHFYDLVGLVAATCITFMANFVFSKFWVFTGGTKTVHEKGLATLQTKTLPH